MFTVFNKRSIKIYFSVAFLAIFIYFAYLCAAYYIITTCELINMEIKKTLQANGFTIQAAADAMGVDRVTLSRTIANNPTINTLRRLSEAVGVPFWEFFADEIPTTPTTTAGVPVCPRCGAPLVISITTPAGGQGESSTNDQTPAAAVQDDRGHAAPLP